KPMRREVLMLQIYRSAGGSPARLQASRLQYDYFAALAARKGIDLVLPGTQALQALMMAGRKDSVSGTPARGNALRPSLTISRFGARKKSLLPSVIRRTSSICASGISWRGVPFQPLRIMSRRLVNV